MNSGDKTPNQTAFRLAPAVGAHKHAGEFKEW